MNLLSTTNTVNVTATRVLQITGVVGALLALAILGASILLRLATVFDADGTQSSILPVAVEGVTRLVHRLSASAVAVLALVAAVVCWLRRRELPLAVRPTVLIVAVTVVLAVIGPLTPGYRYSAVTVANVAGGTLLLVCCWWLRETLAKVSRPNTTHHPLLRVAFAVFFVHVGLGAAASAMQMHGIHWVAFLHSGSAMLTTLLVGAILWDRRNYMPVAGLVRTMTVLLMVQTAFGLVLIGIDERPVWLGFVHAMLSPLLAGGLVSIAVRDAVADASASLPS